MNGLGQRNKAFAAGALIGLLSIYLTYGAAMPLVRFGWHAGSAWALLRWITAHFVHLNSVHLAVNLVALIVLLWAAQRLAVVGGFVGALTASAFAVSLGLALQWWSVAWYCGLSGALHGGFAWLVLRLAVRMNNQRNELGRSLALVLWAGGMCKVLFETLVNNSNASGLLGFPIVPQAHFFGYLGGSLWAGLSALILRQVSRQCGQRQNAEHADK